MENLSKEELIKLYKTLPKDTLIKLGVYDKAKELYEEKQKIERLKKERIEKAITLAKEAQELLNIYRLELKVTPARGIQVINEGGVNIYNITGRRYKIKHGQKTKQVEYRTPILQTLENLGGSGNVNEVLDCVYKKMKDFLVPVDLEKLPSTRQIRWRDTAIWERYYMIKEGLLKSDSPRGIWEISEKGKKYLKEQVTE
ncbi:hypothetical protein CVT91_03975 [Candidatus Atribacteria bacterium HGW-Atribacteria-1]|nr:MAG: hypothetical protein CVT91_03975 [Candidatus Atribacteria bacterium HGW-Atribacteria-1]